MPALSVPVIVIVFSHQLKFTVWFRIQVELVFNQFTLIELIQFVSEAVHLMFTESPVSFSLFAGYEIVMFGVVLSMIIELESVVQVVVFQALPLLSV